MVISTGCSSWSRTSTGSRSSGREVNELPSYPVQDQPLPGHRTMTSTDHKSTPARRAPARLAAAMVLPMLLLFAGCPKDKTAKRDSMPIDTTHLDTTQTTDLSAIHSNLPPAEPDTFKQRKLTPPASS